VTDLGDLIDHMEIDFLILSDHAEAVNGKLYLMGGGWDRRAVADFRLPQAFSVSVGVLIPWSQTNRSIPLTISLTDADGQPIAPPFQSQIVVGRPVNATPGQKLRYMLTINFQMVLPKPGAYVVEAALLDAASRRVTFYADSVPPAPGGPERR
jgi:hypothetical protein